MADRDTDPPTDTDKAPPDAEGDRPNAEDRPDAEGDRLEGGLNVAVTGPTGTFGHGLVPLLEEEPRVEHVVGLARRPFDPGDHGWTKLAYRQGDVRDEEALRRAFEGADVVVHLAFLITGNATRRQIRRVNVEGTLNTFRAARDAGARRFVYASSVAAYGFHPDNPVGITEEWPSRPADRLFYAQEKAELEGLLLAEAEGSPQLALYLLRPSIVLGPHATGGKASVPPVLAGLGRALLGLAHRSPLPIPVPALEVPMQFIHEDDVGSALLLSVLGEGPPGAYNIAGDGTVTGSQIVRELGFTALPVPAGIVHRMSRLGARLAGAPFSPPSAGWIEAFSHPAIMDTTKAREELGWAPRYTGLEALRATLPAD